MSERERWVIYPLLFLALGAALRDKLFDRTITRSVVCQELIVVDDETVDQQPIVLARIGRSTSARETGVKAHMIVNGQLHVDLINAKAYAFRNLPFVPPLQATWPGPFDLFRSLRRSMQTPRDAVRQPAPPPDESQPTAPQQDEHQGESAAGKE